MQTFKITTLSAGSANLHVQGVDFLIERRESDGVWFAYMDGQGAPLDFGLTRKVCAERLLEVLGITGEIVGGGRPCKPEAKSEAPEKANDSAPVTIYSHRQGLTVYGADEVCAKFAQVSGKVSQVPGKYGKPGGYRLPADMRPALWARLQESCQGRTLKVVKGKTKSVSTIPALQ